MQPPQGLVEKVQRPEEAEVDRRLDAEDGLAAAPSQEVVLTGDDVDLDLLPIQRCWPGDPAPFITLPAVITQDPRTGIRNVGMYRMQKIDARSTSCTGRSTRTAAPTTSRPTGGSTVAVALGLDPVTAYSRQRAAAEAHRRVHARRLPARRAGRAGQGEDGRPGGARERRDRPRGLRRAGRARPIEGPFGDHTGYYTPAEPFPVFHADGDDDAPRRDLSVDRRRQAAGRRTRGSARRPSGSSCPRSG